MVLALAFHGPLVAGGLFRYSWDAAAHAYGQLPTVVALTLALFLVAEFTRFVERGGAIQFGLMVGLSGTVFAAPHATALFLVPALLAASATVLPGSGSRALPVRLRRLILAAIGCALAGAIVVLPFWLWARGGIPDAFIPHNSRSDFLHDLNAQALFLWGVYGLIPALAVYGLWRRPDRRTAAVAVLAAVLGVLGLGGTTPLPALVFGRQWEVLAYDRFALWGVIALLPLAGIAISHLLSLRIAAGRVLAIAALTGVSLFAGADAVM